MKNLIIKFYEHLVRTAMGIMVYICGDISYARLNKIPFAEVQWYHALKSSDIIIINKISVPVSTSFLVLSAFASTFVLEKMLMKSINKRRNGGICYLKLQYQKY